MSQFDDMTLEELEAATADLEARRMEAMTAFKTEATAIRDAREAKMAVERMTDMVSNMTDDERRAMLNALTAEENSDG